MMYTGWNPYWVVCFRAGGCAILRECLRLKMVEEGWWWIAVWLNQAIGISGPGNPPCSVPGGLRSRWVAFQGVRENTRYQGPVAEILSPTHHTTHVIPSSSSSTLPFDQTYQSSHILYTPWQPPSCYTSSLARGALTVRLHLRTLFRSFSRISRLNARIFPNCIKRPQRKESRKALERLTACSLIDEIFWKENMTKWACKLNTNADQGIWDGLMGC